MPPGVIEHLIFARWKSKTKNFEIFEITEIENRYFPPLILIHLTIYKDLFLVNFLSILCNIFQMKFSRYVGLKQYDKFRKLF